MNQLILVGYIDASANVYAFFYTNLLQEASCKFEIDRTN